MMNIVFFFFQHKLQALESPPVIREVSLTIIKMIMKEYTIMRAINYSCIEREVCLFSISMINAPDFYAFTSSTVVVPGLL